MPAPDHDLLIAGGGINGCGIARDAAGRGLNVLLAERDDLASATSSASTKLIHGGLRYLEFYEFGLVRKALKEREVLLAAAPHIIHPKRFILPHHSGLRPAWLLRLGLFLYDHLGGRKRLAATSMVDLTKGEYGAPLKPLFTKAFEYADCWVDDARLVVLNAIDAWERGATILTRTEVVSARQDNGLWRVGLYDRNSGKRSQVLVRAMVNATGPWAGHFLSQVLGRAGSETLIRPVKGSHIVVPKLYAHDRCYIFQNGDGRIIFTIPWEDDYTVIGTTDVDVTGNLDASDIETSEIDYLCAAASEYFTAPVVPADVVHTYSGIRPLYNDGADEAQEATRDYVLQLEAENGAAPLLNIFGGKLTTYRELAGQALEKLSQAISIAGQSWTAHAPLPGGDFAVEAFDDEVEKLKANYSFLDNHQALRLFRAYGTRAHTLLGKATRPADLGKHFGAGLHAAEVGYLMELEWARTPDDILWRRSKLGMRLSKQQVLELAKAMKSH